MKKQVSHFSIHQTSKVLAILHFVFAAVVLIPLGIYTVFAAGGREAIWLFIVPFLIGIFYYIGLAIAFWVYNLVAGTFGGIEVTLADKE